MASITVDDVAHDLRLHASDFIPNKAQTQDLKSVVQNQDNNIQLLDAQILSLEAQLSNLRVQRGALIRSSTVKKALLAPIRRLAPETLGQVFELCNDSSNTPGVRRIITADSTPILLGLVCRKWRRVACGTPQLWTVLSLERTSETTSKVNPFVVIPEWLRRSGGLPIDIYLGDGLEKLFNTEKYAKDFLSCMEMLGDHFDRCRSFHVTNGFPRILAAMFPQGRNRNASALRDFRVIPSTSLLPLRPLVLGQITAPNLERIDVYRPSTFFESIALDYSRLRNLRWNTSTSSTDRESSLERLTQVLGLCPNLEECEIVHPSHSASSFDKAALVTVPSLRRLRLKFSLQADPSPLFSVLRTPGLESLTLEQVSPISNVPGFGGALAMFISAASVPLKELRMTRLILTAEDAALLTPLSGLETLQLQNCFLHPAFVAALSPRDGDHPDTWPVPKLSSLSLTSTGTDTAALVEVIQRRIGKASVEDPTYRPRLNSVLLSHSRLSTVDRNIVTNLVETCDGLSIDISDSD